mgnify:CR=1 FL=1
MTTINFSHIRALAIAAGAFAIIASSAASAQSGEEAFKDCATCHSVEKDRHDVGPSLYGVLGRQIGTAEGFRYSNILKAQKSVWTEEALDRFIADPQAMFRGNKMPYSGMDDAKQRAAVIAYLKAATK